MNEPCRWVGCIGMADRNGECAPHAQGYRRHDGLADLRCDNCRKPLRAHEWYQRRDEGTYHAKACVTHPDVMKERERTTA